MNDENELVGKIIQPVPKEEENIGVDTKNDFAQTILEAAQTDQLDISKIENFTNVAKSRESLYQLIDTMGEDNLINFLIECYAEDATQRSESGHIVWVESDDPKVQSYGQYILDVLQIDKDAYSQMFSLIKYGDLFLRMFRESDFEEDDIFDEEEADVRQSLMESRYTNELREDVKDNQSKESLQEDVTLKLYSQQDHYAYYVEKVDNPGEMSELTQRGKTKGFIRAPYDLYKMKNINTGIGTALLDTTWSYDIAKDDVEIFPATSFVHIYLNDTSSRTPEEVNIFTTRDEDGNLVNKHNYKVKRGKSLLYDWFKAWREMTLLENSIILNRLTKSATTKVFKVPVGDMSKNEIRAHLQGIKQLFEQKSAMASGGGMWEYNNPGPVENSVFIPVYEGKGDITVDTVGGEYDPKNLTDLEHFRDKFFSGTGVPKQFAGFTDDAAGFNGGSSLTIISSKYGKKVIKFQDAYIYGITDLLNLFFLDRGLKSYVNNFTVKMVRPITQEEIDNKEQKANNIALLRDTMDTLQDIDDKPTRLKILVSFLKGVLDDVAVLNLLNAYIEKIEEEEKENPTKEPTENEEREPSAPRGGSPMRDLGRDLGIEPQEEEEEPLETPQSTETTTTEVASTEEETTTGGSDYLPSGEELGIDLT